MSFSTKIFIQEKNCFINSCVVCSVRSTNGVKYLLTKDGDDRRQIPAVVTRARFAQMGRGESDRALSDPSYNHPFFPHRDAEYGGRGSRDQRRAARECFGGGGRLIPTSFFAKGSWWGGGGAGGPFFSFNPVIGFLINFIYF